MTEGAPQQPPIGGFCDRCGHYAARHGPQGCIGIDANRCQHGCADRYLLWAGVEWPRPWLPAPEGLKPE